MINKPKLENRPEQPYVGIRACVMMKELGVVLPPLHNQLVDWMEEQGIEPVGAPFFRYLVIDMEKGFDMEVGVPVASFIETQGNIRSGVLPAGSYATLVHMGHYSGLREATQALLVWAAANGVEWHATISGGSEAWEARLEIYRNVGLEKNPEKWETELAFLTAD